MSIGIQHCPILAYTSAETPNTSVYGQPLDSRVVGGDEWQVCAYWATNNGAAQFSFAYKKLVVGKRKLPHGKWSWFITSIELSADDGHNVISVGIDADGYVHLWYDHHANPLHYRRSSAPLATWTGSLTAELSMLGTNETLVTYPQRFYDPQGKMYFIARMTGISSTGTYFAMSYNESTTTWTKLAGTGPQGQLLDGESTATQYSAYLFDVPRFTADWDGAGTGYLHFSWTWRRTFGLTNNDVCHVRWNGTSWTQWDGTAQTVPITRDNARVVLTVAESEELFNQAGSCLDASGRPHLAVIKSDGTRHQLYDLYFTGSAWTLQVITAYSGASSYLDFGRPVMQHDPDTNEVFVWGTHTAEVDGVIQWASNPGAFSTWTKTTFYAADIGVYEPQMDVRKWERDRLVSMFIVRGRDVSAGRETPRIVTRLPKGRNYPFSVAMWGRRHAITVSAAKVGSGGVSGYTLRLMRANFHAQVCDPSSAHHARKDGGDLRFFSDAALQTPLACEVLAFGWDSSTGAGDADVLINVGPLSLSSATDTTIWVAYKSSGAHQPFIDEPYGAIASRDSGWLMDTPLTLTMGRYGVADDSVESWSEQKVIPISAAGATLDGASQIGLEQRARGISSGFAVSALLTDNTVEGNIGAIVGVDDSSDNRAIQLRTDSDGKLRFVRFAQDNTLATNIASPASIRGSQKRIVAEYDGSGSKLLVDGTEVAADAVSTAQHDDSALVWHIGARFVFGTGYQDRLTGVVRALEIHTPRGAAWWVTDSNNMLFPSTFATAGSPLALDGILITALAISNITSSGARAALSVTR